MIAGHTKLATTRVLQLLCACTRQHATQTMQQHDLGVITEYRLGGGGRVSCSDCGGLGLEAASMFRAAREPWVQQVVGEF